MYSEKEMNEVIDFLNREIEAGKITQRDIVNGTNYEKASISQYMKKKYPAKTDEIDKAVYSYYKLYVERQLVKDTTKEFSFVETKNTRIMFEVIRKSHVNKEMAVLVGPSGIGKSTVSKMYETENKNSIYLEVSADYNTKDVINAIHRKLGLGGGQNLHSMSSDIKSKLKNSGYIIIIDQAEYLKTRCIDILRGYWDESQVSIVFIGLPRIKELFGKRVEFAYLHNRVSRKIDLRYNSVDESEKLIKSKLGNISGGIVKKIYTITGGDFRFLKYLVSNCEDIAGINKCDIDEQVVSLAYETMCN